MTAWREIAAEHPAFAAHVERCFRVRKHCTLATLRRDGGPRISGSEVEFDDDGEIYLGMMAGSRKALDLRRDPRLALHCPTVDPPEGDPVSWPGEAKVAGRGVEVPGGDGADESHRFRIDVEEVVLTTVAPAGDHLLIRSWHPGRGLEEFRRR